MIVKFFKSKSAPGIILCIAAILAMIVENSGLSESYQELKKVPVIFQFGGLVIDKNLLLWINDGLMAIFFLLVGLEIKREILEGHLSSKEQVILPTIAAIGGLAVPALIYAFINWGNPEEIHGWAIPAATDIAFALGVMILLGKRIPASLKICLVAIAIIDDLIAIIIIALFYTAETSFVMLGFAFIGLLIAFAMNRAGVTGLGKYITVGVFIWICVLKSGVHATLAGVALGLIIPLNKDNRHGKSPLKELEHALHPFVSFFVLPVFAFVNAGVSLKGVNLQAFTNPVTLGIILGLFFGKQIGVMAITFVATKIKLCKLPQGVNWLQYYGMALLTGIGFTMSLFIGSLAFDDLAHASSVRLGVLTGSILSGIAGVAVLIFSTKNVESSKQANAEKVAKQVKVN